MPRGLPPFWPRKSSSPCMAFPFCCRPCKQAACHITHGLIPSKDCLPSFHSPCFAAFRYPHPLGYLHHILTWSAHKQLLPTTILAALDTSVLLRVVCYMLNTTMIKNEDSSSSGFGTCSAVACNKSAEHWGRALSAAHSLASR